MLLTPVFSYTASLFRKKNTPQRLAMSIIVKNESDIIADNIKFHAHHGVDHFVVMDNGSNDGTYEILKSLTQDYDIHLCVKEDQTYEFRRWRMETFEMASQHFSYPDLVISCDGDEFWMPKNGKQSLKECLDFESRINTAKRYNMVHGEDFDFESKRYYETPLKVQCPILYDRSEQISNDCAAILLTKIGPKVAVNPYGLLSINGGSHRAKHLGHMKKDVVQPDINVYHYPIRSYQQFEKNIIHRKELLKRKDIKMGDHYRRWVRLYDEGTLFEEYKEFFLSPQTQAALEKVGVLIKDDSPKQMIEKALQSQNL